MLPLIVKVEVVLWSLLDELEGPVAGSVVVFEVLDSVVEAKKLNHTYKKTLLTLRTWRRRLRHDSGDLDIS
jgi:hypothetical protein